MGLFNSLRRKKNSDEVTVADLKALVDAQTELIKAFTIREASKGIDSESLEPEPEPADVSIKPKRVVRFNSALFIRSLTEMLERRSNKGLTQEQISTMATSPLKGIANSSFHTFIKAGGFTADKTRRPTRWSLPKPKASPIPEIPALYGASLTIISQQLKGTVTPISLHRSDCFWHERKGAEWLYAQSLDDLRGKIAHLFVLYGESRLPVIKKCSSCVKARRL